MKTIATEACQDILIVRDSHPATGWSKYANIKARRTGPMMLRNWMTSAATIATMVSPTTSLVVEPQRGDVGGELLLPEGWSDTRSPRSIRFSSKLSLQRDCLLA